MLYFVRQYDCLWSLVFLWKLDARARLHTLQWRHNLPRLAISRLSFMPMLSRRYGNDYCTFTLEKIYSKFLYLKIFPQIPGRWKLLYEEFSIFYSGVKLYHFCIDAENDSGNKYTKCLVFRASGRCQDVVVFVDTKRKKWRPALILGVWITSKVREEKTIINIDQIQKEWALMLILFRLWSYHAMLVC